jgi:outer membrane protein TolC
MTLKLKLICLTTAIVQAGLLPITLVWAENEPSLNTEVSAVPTASVENLSIADPKPAEPEVDTTAISLLSTTDSTPTNEMEGVTETAEPIIIDLPLVIEQVLNNNRQLLYAKSKVSENKAEQLRARAQFLPNITGEFSYENYDGGTIFIRQEPVQVKRKTYYPKLVFDLPIPLGGANFFQLQSAKYLVQSALYGVDKTTQEQLLKGVKAYYNVQASEGKIQAAKQALKESEENTLYQQSRMKAGVGKKLDWLQAQGTQANQSLNLLVAENQRFLGLADLETILAKPVLGISEIKQEASVPQFWIPETLTLEQCLKEAQTNRPDLKELQSQLAEARADLRTIKSRLVPTINLGSYIGGVGPELGDLSKVFQAGIRARVDLLNQLGVDSIGRIRSQKARIEQKNIELETKLAESQRQTLESYQRVQLLKHQRELLESKLIANQEAYRIAKLRQASQVGIYLEVSQTLNDLVATQSEFVTTMMQYNSAQAELLFQMGQLTPAILLGLNPQTPTNALPQLKTP